MYSVIELHLENELRCLLVASGTELVALAICLGNVAP